VPLRPVHQHAWDIPPAAARALQAELAGRIERADRFGTIELVAGIDIGFEADGALTRAAVAVLRLPELMPVEEAIARRPTAFPYVPGLLSFRETPISVAKARIPSAGKPRRRRPLMVGMRGSSQPRTWPSFTRRSSTRLESTV